MYLLAIGWLYVALMMSLAEGTSSQGSWLGAFFTFVLYGLLPVAILLYILGSPARRRARLRAEMAERAEHEAASSAATSAQPDDGSHAAAEPLAPVGKEP